MPIDFTHVPQLRVTAVTGTSNTETIIGDDTTCLVDRCGEPLPDARGKVACPACGTLYDVTVKASFTQLTLML